MKQIIHITLLVFLFLTACSPSKKLLDKGLYDQAINKSLKKIKKKPGKSDEVAVLDKAYKMANEIDLKQVKYLKQENQPDNWEEIFQLFSQLKARQQKVKTVLPLQLNGRTINYKQIDYDKEIIAAKKNAAEYFYSNALKLMDENTKESYRLAYYDFLKAEEYSGGSLRDISSLINESRDKGMSHVIVDIKNNTHIKFHPDFLHDIISFNPKDLRTEWVEYHYTDDDGRQGLDYAILVDLRRVEVSPDIVDEEDFEFKKEIRDGWDYALDKKGNVKKDSLGNDIKVPKYTTISCAVIESRQHKSARITGYIEFRSISPRKLIKKAPISAETFFDHVSARAIGDIRAVDDEMRKLLRHKPLPFPSDYELIEQSKEMLRNSVYDAVRDNRRLIY